MATDPFENNLSIGGITKGTPIDDVADTIRKTFGIPQSDFQVEILSIREGHSGIKWNYVIIADSTVIHEIASRKDKLNSLKYKIDRENVRPEDVLVVTLSYKPDETRNTKDTPIKFLNDIILSTDMDIRFKVIKHSDPSQYSGQDVINLDIKNTKSCHFDLIKCALYAVDTYWSHYCLCLTTDYYDKDDKKDYRGPNYFTYPRERGKELSKLHGASK